MQSGGEGVRNAGDDIRMNEKRLRRLIEDARQTAERAAERADADHLPLTRDTERGKAAAYRSVLKMLDEGGEG